MSFDLTNKNISDTFQNLLQRTGSDNQLYDLEGNLVDNLTIVGNISASGTISAKKFKSSDADGDIDFSGSIDIAGNITASGTISSSGGISEFDKILTTGFRIRQPEIGTVHLVIKSHSDSGRAEDGDIMFSIPGDISASGTVYASTGSFGRTETLVDQINVAESHYSASIFSGSIFVSGSTPGYAATITADGDISASGTIYATSLEIGGSALSGNLTVNDITASGGISASGNINASGLELNAVNGTDDFFLLKSASLAVLKINNDGVLQLGGFIFTPTAVSGGFYYNDVHDEFYLGKKI